MARNVFISIVPQILDLANAAATRWRDEARAIREQAEAIRCAHSARVGHRRGQNPYDLECDAATAMEEHADHLDTLASRAESVADQAEALADDAKEIDAP